MAHTALDEPGVSAALEGPALDLAELEAARDAAHAVYTAAGDS